MSHNFKKRGDEEPRRGCALKGDVEEKRRHFVKAEGEGGKREGGRSGRGGRVGWGIGKIWGGVGSFGPCEKEICVFLVGEKGAVLLPGAGGGIQW